MITAKQFLRSLFLTLWIFGLIVFVYVWTNVYVFPQDQYAGLSNYVNIPTDLVGVSSFIIAGISFFLWNLIKDNK
jgi:hypothetical protein